MDSISLKKQIGLRIKQLRTGKGWSRQQAAIKLNMSPTTYGNIERGETDMCITWLVQVADIFGAGLSDLLNFEKAIYNFTGTHSNCHNLQINSASSDLKEVMLKNELEKCQLEISYLKEENARLVGILDWLKNR